MKPAWQSLFFALIVLATTVGCSRHRAAPPPPSPEQPSNEPSSGRPTSQQPERMARDDSTRAQRDALARQRRQDARHLLEQPIYFDFDRFDLTGDTRMALEAKLELLNTSPSVHLRIEGHADERGSDEYNIALGQRRAAAAKRFFVQRGVSPERIETVSFGEHRPICQLSAESCWSQNRRAEFAMAAGEFTFR